MISILNKGFRYTPAASTDIRKTIRREQKRLAEEAAKQKAENEAISVEQFVKVHVLKGTTK